MSGRNAPKSERHKQKIRTAMLGRDCPWMQEVNRNPEKIRKTAEKHTGMKRSEETCKNISESLKGKYVGDKNNNFKGYYLTPIGKFAVLEEAAEKLGLGTVTIWQRCTKLNENKILKFSLGKDKNLKESDLGKTWKEIGYGFLPKDSIKNDENIPENISETSSENNSEEIP